MRSQCSEKPYPECGLKVASLAASTHVGKRARPVRLHGAFESFRDLIQSLVPRYLFELVAYPFEGVFQPIFVVLIMSYFQSLATTVTFTARVLFVSTNLRYAVLFDYNF